MALALRPCWLGLGGTVSLVSGYFSDSLITLGKPFSFSVPQFPSPWSGEKQQCISISTSLPHLAVVRINTTCPHIDSLSWEPPWGVGVGAVGEADLKFQVKPYCVSYCTIPQFF